MEKATVQLSVQRTRCPYCKDEVRPADPKAACGACMAWHHDACWGAHAACSGCSSTQVLRSAPTVEAPLPHSIQLAPAPTQGAVLRPCSVSLCPTPATELVHDDHREMCRPHALARLRRMESAASQSLATLTAILIACVVVAAVGYLVPHTALGLEHDMALLVATVALLSLCVLSIPTFFVLHARSRTRLWLRHVLAREAAAKH